MEEDISDNGTDSESIYQAISSSDNVTMKTLGKTLDTNIMNTIIEPNSNEEEKEDNIDEFEVPISYEECTQNEELVLDSEVRAIQNLFLLIYR